MSIQYDEVNIQRVFTEMRYAYPSQSTIIQTILKKANEMHSFLKREVRGQGRHLITTIRLNLDTQHRLHKQLDTLPNLQGKYNRVRELVDISYRHSLYIGGLLMCQISLNAGLKFTRTNTAINEHIVNNFFIPIKVTLDECYPAGEALDVIADCLFFSMKESEARMESSYPTWVRSLFMNKSLRKTIQRKTDRLVALIDKENARIGVLFTEFIEGS